jgi:pimeloyl-ACP methyl ester carboxylesterase
VPCASAVCDTTSAGQPRAQAETILFLHRSLGNGDDWRRTVAALRTRYRCLTPDLIGHGAIRLHLPADGEQRLLQVEEA